MPQPRKPLDCNYCPGQQTCFLRNKLSNDSFQKLEAARRSYSTARGELLFRDGDGASGVWMICTGKVKRYKMTATGKALISDVMGPGSILGCQETFARMDHSDFAEILEAGIVAHIPAKDVRDVTTSDPTAAAEFLAMLARNLVDRETAAIDLAYGTARERVMAVLEEYRDDHSDDPTQIHPTVRMRRQDLAELAGLTVETTVRTLKDLEKDRQIELRGRLIVLSRCLRGETPLRAVA